MRKRIIFGTILGSLTIIVIAAALFLPSLVYSQQSTSGVAQSVTGNGNSILYATGGMVVLHMPAGGGALANRPTDLLITASNVYHGEGVFFGTANTLQIQVWVPPLNSFLPIATITDNNDPNFLTWVKSLTNGSAISQNIIQLQGSPDPLFVGRTGDIVTVNLTVPVNIAVGDPFPAYLKALNFTLPPFTLEFRSIGAAFQTSTTTVSPTSGWTIQTSAWVEPAWTRVWVPQWLGSNYLATDGTITLDANITYISP